MARKSTFVKGSSTFICSCCGHNTRWTGEQGIDSKTCPICWDLAGLENVEQDGQMTEAYQAEINSLFGDIAKRSEAELAKALKSFDLIAKYYKGNATEEQAPKAEAQPVAASTRNGAVAICKMLMKNNPGLTRKAFIALAVEMGIHKGTAGTQYNRIKKEG